MANWSWRAAPGPQIDFRLANVSGKQRKVVVNYFQLENLGDSMTVSTFLESFAKKVENVAGPTVRDGRGWPGMSNSCRLCEKRKFQLLTVPRGLPPLCHLTLSIWGPWTR